MKKYLAPLSIMLLLAPVSFADDTNNSDTYHTGLGETVDKVVNEVRSWVQDTPQMTTTPNSTLDQVMGTTPNSDSNSGN